MTEHFPPGHPETPREVRADFRSALDHIDDMFVTAGVRVADAVSTLSGRFLEGDRSAIEEAVHLSIDVGNQCTEIEERAFVILAREAPVSGDLRRLVALLRTTTDVDRSASLLKHVLESLDRMDPRMLPASVRTQVAELAARSAEVFSAGVDAWRRGDGAAVFEVDRADEAVDSLQLSLLDRAAELDEAGNEMLVLGLIARYYERIADHGVSIAQDAAFVVTGDRIPIGKGRIDAEPNPI
jgi:phosphate transport system protein